MLSLEYSQAGYKSGYNHQSLEICGPVGGHEPFCGVAYVARGPAAWLISRNDAS